MELLLVLAILVIAAAASMPSIRALSRGAQLRDAADRVRVEWTRAHVKAMKTGRIHVFLCELGGTHYKVQPYIAGTTRWKTPRPIQVALEHKLNRRPISPSKALCRTAPSSSRAMSWTAFARKASKKT